jgi:hypothetical protein
MDWWKSAERALSDVPHAIAGAVAANAYMPARQTRDLDIAVAAGGLARADAALNAAGWSRVGDLSLVIGASYGRAGNDIDVLELPEEWGAAAVAEAQTNIHNGMATLTLPYLVLMKLEASRVSDVADITRMLGGADESSLEAVRNVVRRYGRADDADDLEQVIRLGKLEREG